MIFKSVLIKYFIRDRRFQSYSHSIWCLDPAKAAFPVSKFNLDSYIGLYVLSSIKTMDWIAVQIFELVSLCHNTWSSVIQVASSLIKSDHKYMISNSILRWSITFLEYDSPQRNYNWYIRFQNPKHLKWVFCENS